MDPLLAVESVTKRHGRVEALRGVSFDVAAGELFGLLGPNGAGKSTLFGILAGLSAATSGAVRLAGQPFGPHRRDLRPLVGIAPQDLALYPDLTARENLTFFGELYGLRGPALYDRTHEVLAGIALTDRADQRVAAMSGGMKRRLNLGVAVLHRPKLLLLDEPTTGVDPQSRHHIFETVRALNRDGMTVVYTSHAMEEVEALCTRIAVIDVGRVVACDTLAGLLAMRDGEVRYRLDGEPVAVRTADPSATLRAVIRDHGDRVTALESRPATLETVFLHLTGRDLRD